MKIIAVLIEHESQMADLWTPKGAICHSITLPDELTPEVLKGSLDAYYRRLAHYFDTGEDKDGC